MTSTEKAFELYQKFSLMLNLDHNFRSTIAAKKCAKVAVEEIIESNKSLLTVEPGNNSIQGELAYWEDVLLKLKVL